jgi:hypothetical protein
MPLKPRETLQSFKFYPDSTMINGYQWFTSKGLEFLTFQSDQILDTWIQNNCQF